MAEFILSKDYLILLLNKAFRHGRKVLRIKDPFYGLELFAIDDKMRISKIVSRREYEEQRHKVVRDLGRLHNEAPEWFDFKDCFLSSGAPAFMAHSVSTDKRGRVMAALGQGMLFVNTRGGSGGPGMGAVLAIPSVLGSILGGFVYTYNSALP